MAETVELLRVVARRLACGAVACTVGMALVGSSPVRAQVPDLLPSSTTSAPGPTTTLLPPLVPTEPLVPTDPLVPPPADDPGAKPGPAPALLPSPVPAPSTSRTTIFTPTPIPPRTPLRASVSSVPNSRSSSAPATVAPVEREAGDAEGEGPSALPYGAGADNSELAAGTNDVELGVQASQGRNVGSLASIAAGLIASVLLAMVVWVQAQVRREELEPA